jgi:maltose O-acetyltransferase
MAGACSRFIVAVRRQFDGVEPRFKIPLAIGNHLPTYALGAARLRLLRFAGIRIGRGSGIGGKVLVAGGASPARHVVIGADCFLNDGCRFDSTAPITIGDGVYVGHDVAILTATHDIDGPHRRAGHLVGRSVTIEHGVWIGARATILPGVTIGHGAVVAAGAVVTSSVEPDTVVGGVPARLLRKLEDGDTR